MYTALLNKYVAYMSVADPVRLTEQILIISVQDFDVNEVDNGNSAGDTCDHDVDLVVVVNVKQMLIKMLPMIMMLSVPWRKIFSVLPVLVGDNLSL